MILSIADLHFDDKKTKPMDIFGKNWINHENKILDNWKEVVHEGDLVLLPGDISWATKLNEAINDLSKIDKLPGKKIISKGNHDYWWASQKKLYDLNFKSIDYLHNNSFNYEGVAICGARGWESKDSPDFSKEDQKIYDRELNRFKNSINSIKGGSFRIAMLHYPPYNGDFSPNEFTYMLCENNIDLCIYGHLHGPGHKYVYEGEILGVKLKCVSSDFVDFKLQEIYGKRN